MAASGFWQRIRRLFRQPKPTTAPTRAPSRQIQPQRTPIVSPQPVVTAPQSPPAGPLDQSNIITTIHEAGRQQKLLQITYDGATRLVEPYSFREGKTGRLFYGFCSIHQRIHSFRPELISHIEITNQTFTPRWEVEL